MEFEDAIRALKQGKRITRGTFSEGDWIELRDPDGLVCSNKTKDCWECQLDYKDIVADDWEVYEPKTVVWSMTIDDKEFRCVTGYGNWVVQCMSPAESEWKYVDAGNCPQELFEKFCKSLEFKSASYDKDKEKV